MDSLRNDTLSTINTNTVQLFGEIGLAQFEAAERLSHIAWDVARGMTESGLRGIILMQRGGAGEAFKGAWEDHSLQQVDSSLSTSMDVWGELARSYSMAIGRYLRTFTFMDIASEPRDWVAPWLSLVNALPSAVRQGAGELATASRRPPVQQPPAPPAAAPAAPSPGPATDSTASGGGRPTRKRPASE